MVFRRICLFALSLLLLLSACGGKPDESAEGSREERIAEKIAEEAVRQAGGKEFDIDIQGDSVRIKGKDGDISFASGKGTKLPGDFPKDIPVYAGATVLSSAVSQQEQALNVTWMTEDDTEKVVEFLKSGMQDGGWAAETSLNMPNQVIMGYSKGDRSASFIVAGSEEKTTITLTAAQD